MASALALTPVEEFMSGPLVAWFKSCIEKMFKEVLTYDDLIDGCLIHKVFSQMDLQIDEGEVLPVKEDPEQRTRNLKTILANLRQFYEEELGQVVLQLPDVQRLAKEPQLHAAEAELLLCLLLGCAVQCPNKERFISRITHFDEETQKAIAERIAQVVHTPDIVLSSDMLTCTNDDNNSSFVAMHEANVHKAFGHVRRLYRERNIYREKLQNMVRHRHESSFDEEGIQDMLNCSIRSEREETLKRDAELLECKSKLRTQRETIKEQCEQLIECKEELLHYRQEMTKLRHENEKLVSEARSAKCYRDELDAANEKAEKADRLEQEIVKYKEKLSSIDFYKTRLDEVQEDNRLLIENKEMLVEEVKTYKAKAERLIDLEKHIFEMKQQVNDLTLENAAWRKKYEDLCDENSQLERLVKESTREALECGFMQDCDEPSMTFDSSLSEQLSNSAQSKALKLELENRRLSSLVDTLKENSFHESSHKLLDLEKDKKRLSLTVGSLSEDVKKLSVKNRELEGICKKALDENERLRHVDVGELSTKLEILEKKHDHAVKEKRRVQSLLNTVQKRSRELETRLAQTTEKLATLELQSKKTQSFDGDMREEHERLREDFGKLYVTNERLSTDYQKLVSKFSQHRKETEAKNEKIIDLEIQLGELRQRCKILDKMNHGLDKDKRALMDHVSLLLKQNHELIAQSLEDREFFHLEELKNTDRMHNVLRQKEKLEEKIMDHYRRLSNCPVKKRSLVKSTIFKMRRAGSELLNRSRRSWADDSTAEPATEKSYDFEFSRTRDSDASLINSTAVDNNNTSHLNNNGKTRAPRESNISSLFERLVSSKRRKSGDFLDNFKPSEFDFEKEKTQQQLQAQKSIDIVELFALENAESGDDLDKTLNEEDAKESDSGKEESSPRQEDEESQSQLSSSKSVDLSESDEDPRQADIVPDEAHKKLMYKRVRKPKPGDGPTVRSRHAIWLDQGCA